MSVDEKGAVLGELKPDQHDLQGLRPIKIRVMSTMYGHQFYVRCRACAMVIAYTADLDTAFECADRHVYRHRIEIAERERTKTTQRMVVSA